MAICIVIKLLAKNNISPFKTTLDTFDIQILWFTSLQVKVLALTPVVGETQSSTSSRDS